MSLTRKKDDILYWCLVALTAYMPLHYFVCELFISFTNLDNILRDAVILVLAALVFFNRDNFTKPMNLTVGASVVFLAVCGICSTLQYRLLPILNILRTYLVPILLFYVARVVSFDQKRFTRFNRLLIIEFAVLAVYGYIQAFFLGDKFLLAIGYPQNEIGGLAGYSYYISHFFGHQRSVGTFVSPNIFGAVLAVAASALCFGETKLSYPWKFALCGSLVLGIMATFSRSAILGFACGVFVCWFLRKSWKRITKKTLRCWGCIALVAAAFLLFDYLVFDSLFLRMFLSTVFRTFNGEDPSANAHKEHLTELPVVPVTPDLPNVTRAPSWWLPDFGINGPMAEEFITQPYKVESSYYLMFRELGVPGTLLYFAPVGILVYKTIRDRKTYPYFVPICVAVSVLVGYVFLPNVQTFEIPFYLYLYLGFYENASVKALYEETV